MEGSGCRPNTDHAALVPSLTHSKKNSIEVNSLNNKDTSLTNPPYSKHDIPTHVREVKKMLVKYHFSISANVSPLVQVRLTASKVWGMYKKQH